MSISERYREYLHGDHWRSFRSQLLTTTGYCQRCGLSRRACRILYGHDLDVHHLTYHRIGGELPQDVQVLCRFCHEQLEWQKAVQRVKNEGMAFSVEISWRGCLGLPERHANCRQCGDEVVVGQCGPDEFGSPPPRLAIIQNCSCEWEDPEELIGSLPLFFDERRLQFLERAIAQ
jgi:hypothetical protein